jgi:hypothetical protein
MAARAEPRKLTRTSGTRRMSTASVLRNFDGTS